MIVHKVLFLFPHLRHHRTESLCVRVQPVSHDAEQKKEHANNLRKLKQSFRKVSMSDVDVVAPQWAIPIDEDCSGIPVETVEELVRVEYRASEQPRRASRLKHLLALLGLAAKDPPARPSIESNGQYPTASAEIVERSEVVVASPRRPDTPRVHVTPRGRASHFHSSMRQRRPPPTKKHLAYLWEKVRVYPQ